MEPGAAPVPEEAEASVPKTAELADGSVTYTFAADDKSMQEKAARFLEDIKARLRGAK